MENCEDGEIGEESEDQVVVAKFATTTQHGAIEGKTQTHMTEYYNLDVIISVGYRVKSKRGVEFRRWANSVLKKYILQGYAVNGNRIRQLGEVIRIMKRTQNALDSQQVRFGAESDLFGKEKDDSFKGSIGNIYQSFSGQELYPTLEEKAAHLLYFVTLKNRKLSGMEVNTK